MKNKKIRGGGVLCCLILALSMILSQVSVFAETAEVPMLLTVETKPLDFTVTERIDMSVYQGETDISMNSVTVTNTGTEDLKVSSIEITPETGWSVAGDARRWEAPHGAAMFTQKTENGSIVRALH